MASHISVSAWTLAVISAIACLEVCEPAHGLSLNGVDLRYPEARQSSTRDLFHGEVQPNPYDWMEVDDAPEPREFARQQSALTRRVLDTAPQRARFASQLMELSIATAPIPKFERGLGFTSNGSAISLYNRETRQSEPLVSLTDLRDQAGGFDLTTDKPAIFDYSLSPDRSKLAILVAFNGKDFGSKIYIYDLATKRALASEVIDRALSYTPVFGTVASTAPVWTTDSRSFFYTRFSTNRDLLRRLDIPLAPGESHIARHRLGESGSLDQVIFRRGGPGADRNEILQVYPLASADELLVTMFNTFFAPNFVGILNWRTGAVRYLQESAEITGADRHFGFMGEVGGRLYFRSNLKARNGGVISIDRNYSAATQVQEVVSGREENLELAFIASNRILLVYVHQRAHRLEVRGLNGRLISNVTLPGQGTLSGFSLDPQNNQIYFGYSDLTSPRRLMVYDVASLSLTELHRPQTPFVPSDFLVKRDWMRASDGAQIPITIFESNSSRPWSQTPVYLYFYGNIAAAVLPNYQAKYVAWVQNGGRLVIAHVRGGTDLDWEWAQAGIRRNKGRSIQDAIDVAKGLTARWQVPAKNIVAAGRSSAGFSSAAAVLRSPESFGMLATTVPLADMLRYERFTCGTRWEIEYGMASDPSDYDALREWSPLLLSQPNQRIPPTVIFTAEKDDRVPPHHAMKLAATLQRNSGHVAPVLLYEEPGLSHTARREALDELTFASLVLDW